MIHETAAMLIWYINHYNFERIHAFEKHRQPMFYTGEWAGKSAQSCVLKFIQIFLMFFNTR